jgi:hypothetical protein
MECSGRTPFVPCEALLPSSRSIPIMFIVNGEETTGRFNPDELRWEGSWGGEYSMEEVTAWKPLINKADDYLRRLGYSRR